MCTRYVSPDSAALERIWHVGRPNPWRWPQQEVFPGYAAPFIRAARESGTTERELVVGQWNLVPWFAESPKLKFATCNARSEELAVKASYKHPWARGQRCVIPAQAFFEPNWESGRHVPWRFERADGEPWSLAGLWNTWVDKASGEIVESFTMLTLNADAHPLMSRMHRPDPKREPHRQDKRSVVPIAPADVDHWLHGTMAEIAALIALPDTGLFVAGPSIPA
jgi:putative SOS response-associated peptidase YedK